MLGRTSVRPPALLAILILVFLLTSCARRYRAEGLVLQVEPAGGTLLVSHREIRGYMPPMVMPVRVRRAADLNDLRPGDRIAFDLLVRSGEAVARNLRQAPESSLDGGGDDLVLPEPPEKVRPGETVPDFELTDQLGRRVRLSAFRDRIAIVNFIYTRCPLPEVCPRLAASFARLQRRFAERMGIDLALLSVTLDPQFDTPPVLADYARKWRANADAWRFLTGTPAEVEAVARRFGVIYWPEEGLITHTSSTGVVGRDGRLLARVDGSSFEPEQLGDLVAQYLK